MPDILHRLTIDASPALIHDLVSSADGIAQWWTGRPLTGDTAVGQRFSVYFGDSEQPAADLETVSDAPGEVVWRVVGGPQDWLSTVITFGIRGEAHGGTTLLFTHAGWAQANEFMSGCSTNWGSYLTSLKLGAEGAGFHPFPEGEVSRWG